VKYIAHRALFDGPDPARENHPDQILAALAAGWDCEIDVWWDDKHWYLGHDVPEHQVTKNFLYRPGLWMHCKNLEALTRVATLRTVEKAHFFWHNTDDYTLTSHGFIWTYPGKELTEDAIWNQPEIDIDWRVNVKNQVECYGICSKHVDEISKRRSQHHLMG